jgi:HAD superfamily hydrolase (TIGR01549 family)
MFDLDGTLVDTSSLYLEGVPQVVRRHLGRDIDVSDYMDLWGHDVRQWFARAAGEERDAAVDAMYADFEAYYIANHQRCPDYLGVAEALESLKSRGHRVGIVTTRPQRRAELVRELPWAPAIDFVVGGDRVKHRKPAPDSLDFAIARYCGTGQAWSHVYIGDNASDIVAAKASRYPVTSVAALWGCRDRESLLAAGPDRACESVYACTRSLLALRDVAA